MPSNASRRGFTYMRCRKRLWNVSGPAPLFKSSSCSLKLTDSYPRSASPDQPRLVRLLPPTRSSPTDCRPLRQQGGPRPIPRPHPRRSGPLARADQKDARRQGDSGGDVRCRDDRGAEKVQGAPETVVRGDAAAEWRAVNDVEGDLVSRSFSRRCKIVFFAGQDLLSVRALHTVCDGGKSERASSEGLADEKYERRRARANARTKSLFGGGPISRASRTCRRREHP